MTRTCFMLWRATVVAAGLCLAAGAALAQEFPARTVRLIVPFAPGNGVDILARSLADGVTKLWSQSVIVENRPGANGILAVQEFMKGPPDGHTYFVGDVGSIAVNPSLYKKLPYDPQKDMVPVTDVMSAPWVLFTSKSNKINSLGEFMERAKANPGKLTYGSTGLGAPNFLAAEFLKMRTGIDLLQVPYRDGNQLHAAAATGEITLMISSWATAQPSISHLQPLAVAAAARQPNYQNVPTVHEAIGLNDFEVKAWAALMARSGTPQAILDKVHKDFVTVIRQSQIQGRAAKIGIEVTGKKPEEIASLIKSETERYKAVIQRTGAQKD